jgi:hypothetical protein
MIGKGFDARGMPKIQPVDLQAILEGVEVRLAAVAQRCIARKARAHEHARARAQQHDRRLVADLHARAADVCHPSAQVRSLRALLIVEVAAAITHLIVEVVQPLHLRLADVAAARLDQLRCLPVLALSVCLCTRLGFGRDERGQEALPAYAGTRELHFIGLAALALDQVAVGARELFLLHAIGMGQASRRHQQTCALVLAELRQARAVCDQLFEQAHAGFETVRVDHHRLREFGADSVARLVPKTQRATGP